MPGITVGIKGLSCSFFIEGKDQLDSCVYMLNGWWGRQIICLAVLFLILNRLFPPLYDSFIMV